MNEYSKAIAGGFASTLVAFLTWATVTNPHWQAQAPPLQALWVVAQAVFAGSGIVYYAPANRHR